MFNKLRNRFLIVNLVIITFMMLLAFASIYTITYQNVQRDIEMELHRVSEFYSKPNGNIGGPWQSGGGGGIGGGNGGSGGGSSGSGSGKFPQESMGNANPPPERSVSFSLHIDKQWSITTINSRFDMDSDFYELAKQAAVSSNSDNGQFNLDGNRWAYTLKKNDAGYFIVYLDVTAQQKIVTNLVYTFLVVGLFMLIVIFLTSRYFANRSIAPVKEAFNKQKQFIGDASHELKTPLAVINTNADVLLSNSEDTIHNQSKWLHYIKSETARMTKLTNDLLYLTEMDDSRAGMIYTTFNVSEAVESVILTMEAVMFEKHISLSYEIEPELRARGNSEQMKQVVMILLDNCVKYTNPKGSINITLKKRHNDVLLSVANTGEGIPPEHLERIFDRFYRADSSRSRKQGGYGLGLAIAKSIVEQHKGKIYAKSVIHESTTFYVQLPEKGRTD